MVRGRLFNFLLLPAFMLAHFICACAPNSAQAYAAPTSPSQESSAHSCCKGEEDGQETPQPDDHHDHDCQCHCGDLEGKAVVTERVNAPDVQMTLLPFHLLSSVAYLLPELTLSRLQSFPPWLSDLSPPPDLLRVKCTLQI